MTFHFFHINEIYSNADGSVQFIEFVGDADGQHEWAGHSLTSTSENGTITYPIATNLSTAATQGKSVLMGTQGFANLGIVTPDYIIPNGFLSTVNGTINFPGMVGGNLTYAQLPIDRTSSLKADGTTGTNSPTNFAGNTGSIAPNNVIAGTEGPDNLIGLPGDDVIQAGGGQDTINGGAGNDTLDGGSGIDTALYNNTRANYTLSNTAISGPDGNDTLAGIERLQFADKNVAIDLGAGQSANSTVRIIGAAFDAPTIQEHPEYVGIGLNLFDSGQSLTQVSQLAIDVMGALTNDAFVDTVYQNVVGTAPAITDRDFYVGLLEGNGGTFTQAQLLELAATTEINATNINLIGLQQSGVEFT
jgi:hypothetical protein